MATQTAGGRRGRTIYMDDESWELLAALDVPGARRGSDSAKLEALVRAVPRLEADLRAAREENRRLRADLQRVHDLGLQVEMAQVQVESALQTVIERLQPVQQMVWSALRGEGTSDAGTVQVSRA